MNLRIPHLNKKAQVVFRIVIASDISFEQERR